MYERLGFAVHRTDRAYVGARRELASRVTPTPSTTDRDELPRWSVADLHESLDVARRSSPPLERAARRRRPDRRALFDEHGVRAIEPRPVTPADGQAADEVIAALNDARRDCSSCSAATSTPPSAPTAATSAAQSLLSRVLSRRGHASSRSSPGSPTG